MSGDSSIAYHFRLIDGARAILQVTSEKEEKKKEYGDLLNMLLQSTYEDMART
jgi:hypothetical protein